MKTIINKFLHWLIIFATSLVALAVVFLMFLEIISPNLQKYRVPIEQFVSQSMSQPVKLDVIELGSRGFEPILRLKNVKVLNDTETAVLLHVAELEIGVDLLGSLFHWQLEPGLLVVRGSTISIEQNADGKITISDLKTTAGESSIPTEFTAMAEWLLTQGKIVLDQLNVTWKPLGQKPTKLTNLHLFLKNRILQHDLALSGNVVQGNRLGDFSTTMRLRGHMLGEQNVTILGEISLNNLSLSLKQSVTPFKLPILIKSAILKLHGHKLSLDFGAMFREPLLVDDFSSNLMLQGTANEWKLSATALAAKNSQISLNGDVVLLSNHLEQGPYIDLHLSFSSFQIPQIKSFVPLTVLSPELCNWLEHAFIQGKSATGTMLLVGPLQKFPFLNNEGHFLIDTDVRNIKLFYREGWPTIDNINGKMIFENNGMRVSAKSTSVLGVKTGAVTAEIPNLLAPELRVAGTINADASDGLKFIFASPLAASIGRYLQGMELSGPMQLGLKFSLPLGTDDAQAKVNGEVKLQNNTLRLVDWNMVLASVNGGLHFTENELLADKIDAVLFSEPVSLSIKSVNNKPQDHITQIDLSGKANFDTMQQNLQLDFLSYLHGMANYQAVLQLHSDTTSSNIFNISSDLNGVSVNLPEPFAKESNSILNCSLSYAFGGKNLTQAKIVYGNRASAALSFKNIAKGKKQLFSGEVVLGQGEANFKKTPGLYVVGKLNKLVWPVWHDFLFPKNKDSKISFNIAQVHLDLNELYAFGQKLQKVILQVEPSDSNWLIELANPNIQGKILIPNDLLHGEIRGELSKLYLQKQEEKSAELAPTDFPALHFLVDDFRYGDMPLGQIELITKPAKNGLQIALLKILAQRVSLNAKGTWDLVAGGSKTQLSGKLSSHNFGALLQDFSVTNSLIGGNATSNFNLHWPGAFFIPNFKAIEGAFNIAIKNGRIINLGSKTETELGFGRVLNLLSLQTLPRRLTLDFSDLLKQGFSFDTLSGDIEVENGSLYTDNLRLDGPAAQVSIDGRVGFRDKDYDMLLTTVPHLTSSIPVIAAIAVNPIVGVATYVADKIIAPAVTSRVTTSLYRIRGSWDNPKIDKI